MRKGENTVCLVARKELEQEVAQLQGELRALGVQERNALRAELGELNIEVPGAQVPTGLTAS